MPKRILAADDERSILNIYTHLFSGAEYSFSKASSFTEAAELIDENTYDLLITDLLFPDGPGLELIKLFQKRQKGAKSLLVTGSDPQSIPKQLLNIHIGKPFKLETLIAAVTAALAGPARADRKTGATKRARPSPGG